MKIDADTIVTFPGGKISSTANIVFCGKNSQNANEILVITDTTPFHPVDYNWPDQPSDKGIMKLNERIISIKQCLIGAIHRKSQEFILDQQIKLLKIKRNDPDWYFVVVHIVESEILKDELANLINNKVTFEVNHELRLALSRSHSACHLAALALNKASAIYWKKFSENYDSLGHPSLDKEAIVLSKISEESSVDYYRCGKSLKRKGFDCQSFLTEKVLKEMELEINNQLLEWSLQGLKIFVKPEESCINDAREWHCIFADGKEATILCGGTHINTIPQGQKVQVKLVKENDQEFKMVSQLI